MKYQLSREFIPFFIIWFSICNSNIGAQVIRLTWSPNTEPDIKYYCIYKDTTTNPVNEISKVYKPNNVYVDADVIIGKGYYYRIAAVDSAENISEFSDEAYVYADNFTQINLISFSAELIENRVILKWNAASEHDHAGFEIQKSDDGKNFNKIGFVSSSATLPDLTTYNFVDSDLSRGSSYYRLKRIGEDGYFEYSHIIMVEFMLPEKFILNQNYPNPFNPETTINFSLVKEGRVSLIIFDILGKVIRKLVDEPKKAGYYEVTWDGKDNDGINASSGIYFCRLIGNGFRETKKIILAR